MAEPEIGYHEDPKNSNGIVRARTTKQIRSWHITRSIKALEKLNEEGLITLLKEDLDQNRPLGEKFGITAIPTLLLFNNGKLLSHPIEVEGQLLVRNGIMVGAAGEQVLRKVIEKM